MLGGSCQSARAVAATRRPLVGRNALPSNRIKLVLPAPVGPMMATRSPAASLRLRPRRARKPLPCSSLNYLKHSAHANRHHRAGRDACTATGTGITTNFWQWRATNARRKANRRFIAMFATDSAFDPFVRHAGFCGDGEALPRSHVAFAAQRRRHANSDALSTKGA